MINIQGLALSLGLFISGILTATETLYVILEKNKVIKSISVGRFPWGIAVKP